MRVAILVEGQTEEAFLPHLRSYLKEHLEGRMPKLESRCFDGRIPTKEKLKRVVMRLLEDRVRPCDHVIALTDIYTGSHPPQFRDAQDAKSQMSQWLGEEKRFHPHAAQYDFEAWLLPYWPYIQRLAKHNQAPPSGNPESVNHDRPPAHRLKELFQIGKSRGAYSKPRDAGRILRDNDLGVAIEQCPELKAFVNTILTVCGAAPIS